MESYIKQWAGDDGNFVKIIKNYLKIEIQSVTTNGVWIQKLGSVQQVTLHEETIHNPHRHKTQQFGFTYDLQANYNPKATTQIVGFETEAQLRYGDNALGGQLRVTPTVEIPPNRTVQVQIKGDEITEEMGLTVRGRCEGDVTVEVYYPPACGLATLYYGREPPPPKAKEGKAHDIFKRVENLNIDSHYRDGSFFFSQQGKVTRTRLSSHSLYIDGEKKFTRSVSPK